MLSCGEDGEHNGVGFIEISNIFVAQDDFLLGAEPFERVYTFPGSYHVSRYSLFILRKPRSPLIFSGDRGFLRVNRLCHG